MLQRLNNNAVLIDSLISTVALFAIVVFYANPHIDGSNGDSLLKLQLAFSKEQGIEILNGWGAGGAERFNRWIIPDFLYALSYAIFFASLFSILIAKKGKTEYRRFRFAIYVAFAAGTLDWIENILELLFVNNFSAFPDALFFMHSVISATKWAALPIALTYIVILLASKTATPAKVRSHER